MSGFHHEAVFYAGDDGLLQAGRISQEEAMNIAAEICIYTNPHLTIEEL